jgi:hypothetical protein
VPFAVGKIQITSANAPGILPVNATNRITRTYVVQAYFDYFHRLAVSLIYPRRSSSVSTRNVTPHTSDPLCTMSYHNASVQEMRSSLEYLPFQTATLSAVARQNMPQGSRYTDLGLLLDFRQIVFTTMQPRV